MSLNLQRGTSPFSTLKKWRSGAGQTVAKNTPAAALPVRHNPEGFVPAIASRIVPPLQLGPTPLQAHPRTRLESARLFRHSKEKKFSDWEKLSAIIEEG